MKLTIREINKSQSIYKKLIELDEQIIKLDKKAMLIADHSQNVELRFTFEGLKESKETLGEETYSPYRSLMTSMLWGGLSEPKESKETLDFQLNDVESLSIFGFIIAMKKQERQFLIGELTKLGFEI